MIDRRKPGSWQPRWLAPVRAWQLAPLLGGFVLVGVAVSVAVGGAFVCVEVGGCIFIGGSSVNVGDPERVFVGGDV